jgi:hypothetical protein
MDILARYGIKEVADVTFYDLDENGMPTNPVLFLDTLKVSTIEQTAEQAEARGGKGNPPLIIWDYGKEINVTLEDALFSAKSMAIMFGNGSVKPYEGDKAYIMKTEQFTAKATKLEDIIKGSAGWATNYEGPDGKLYAKINPKFYTADGKYVKDTFELNGKYFCTFDLLVNGAVIEISANSFPGTYYVTGDTYARSEASGKDEMFQFIIAKAKVQSENTITLEAEGDPSVFNMSLRVMRPADGKMMKLVKYNLLDGVGAETIDYGEVTHNHDLVVEIVEILSVGEGTTEQIDIAGKTLTKCISGNEDIAEVTPSGSVTGNTVGSTTITCEDEKGNTYIVKVEVTKA